MNRMQEHCCIGTLHTGPGHTLQSSNTPVRTIPFVGPRGPGRKASCSCTPGTPCTLHTSTWHMHVPVPKGQVHMKSVPGLLVARRRTLHTGHTGHTTCGEASAASASSPIHCSIGNMHRSASWSGVFGRWRKPCGGQQEHRRTQCIPGIESPRE